MPRIFIYALGVPYASHQQPQARSQLASSLVGVVSQRLLRRKDGSGRVPVCEILVATPAIRTLIREGKMHQREEATRFVGNPRLFAGEG